MTGILCPHCGSCQTTVKDTRGIEGGKRRIRRCFRCEKTFVTIETVNTGTAA